MGTRPKGAVRVRIYRATCTANGKLYIGITVVSVFERRGGHLYYATSGAKSPMPRAIRKYGIDAFVFEQIASAASWPEACLAERDLIVQYGTRSPRGYNATDGGDGTLGVTERSPRWRAAMAEYFSRRVFTQEYKATLSASLRSAMTPEKRARSAETGRRTLSDPAKMAHILAARDTPEWRAKLSAAAKRRRYSAEHCAAISERQRGRILKPNSKRRNRAKWGSPEHIEKLKVAKTGRPQSSETIEKRIAALRGRKRPQETIDKILATKRAKKLAATFQPQLAMEFSDASAP